MSKYFGLLTQKGEAWHIFIGIQLCQGYCQTISYCDIIISTRNVKILHCSYLTTLLIENASIELIDNS